MGKRTSRLENSLTNGELLQIDATLIAGAIIFLSLSIASVDPSTSMQVPQIDSEGLPIDLKLMILEYNLQATDEITQATDNARSAETYFRIVVSATVIIPLCVSAIFSVFGIKLWAVAFLIIGLIMILIVMVLMANLGQSFREEARNRTQIGSDDLENKLQAIRSYIAELSANNTATD
jgi:hypothetical protein